MDNPKTLLFDFNMVFDVFDEYDLLIISFCVAYNDLRHVSLGILELNKQGSLRNNSFALYFLKIAICQLRESLRLLHINLEKNGIYSERINNIPEVSKQYLKVMDQLGENRNAFLKHVLLPARNLGFHYGFKDDEDKQCLRKVAEEISTQQEKSKIIVGLRAVDTYYSFADQLIVETQLKFGDGYISSEEYLRKLGDIIPEVMVLLIMIIDDFLTKSKPAKVNL